MITAHPERARTPRRDVVDALRSVSELQGVTESLEPLLSSLTPRLAALARAPHPPPSAAPLLLAWAAVVQCTGDSDAQEAATLLAGAAEAAGGLLRLQQLLSHDLLLEGRARELAGGALFHALALVTAAFDLRLARVPPADLDALLDLLRELLSHDAALAEYEGGFQGRTCPRIDDARARRDDGMRAGWCGTQSARQPPLCATCWRMGRLFSQPSPRPLRPSWLRSALAPLRASTCWATCSACAASRTGSAQTLRPPCCGHTAIASHSPPRTTPPSARCFRCARAAQGAEMLTWDCGR